MLLTIDLNRERHELPIVVEILGDKVIDISQLRKNTGFITIDPGFRNTIATKRAIIFLNGEKGKLFYSGYPAGQLAEKYSFLEVNYFLSREGRTTH